MYLFGFDISGILLFLKILGFILSLAFAVGIVLSILGKRELAEKNHQDLANRSYTQSPQETQQNKRWQGISAHFKSSNSAEWRMAIIDADTMLEDVLSQLGYKGSTFGEKLKSIRPQDFPYLNDAWEVHKLRNTLAHEGTAYHLSEREAYRAYKIYEDIFHATGYIS